MCARKLAQLTLALTCMLSATLPGFSQPQPYGAPAQSYPTNPAAPDTKWPALDKQAEEAYKKEDYSEAERLWREAVNEANKDQQIEPGLVQLLIKLSKLKDKTGDVAESERLYEFATRTQESMGGKENPRYCDFLPGLADLYTRHGRADRAELTYKDLVSMRERTTPRDEKKLASAYDQYANWLRQQARIEDAIAFETKATNIRAKMQEEGK